MSTKVLLSCLFCLFLFLLPSQLGKHFWPNYSVFQGTRIDYLAPTVYLTDILALLIIAWWLKSQKIRLTGNYYWLGLILLILFNTLLALNSWVAILKWIKVGGLIILGWVIAQHGNKAWLKRIWFVLFTSLVIFSLIGIAQVLTGASLGGIFYWLGERTFSLTTPGLALTSWGGREALRAYSTFSHPNSLAGYLGVGVIVLFWLKQHLSLRTNGLIIVGIGVVIGCLVLTASKGVIVSLIIVGGIALVGTYHQRLLQMSLKLVLWLTILVSVLGLWGGSVNQVIVRTTSNPVKERLLMTGVAKSLFWSHPLFGVGLNNYLIGQSQLELIQPVKRLYQPVHNVVLLILTESGLVGLVMLLVFLNFWINTALHNHHWGLVLAVFFIALTGTVDHYWWSLQQNLFLLPLVFGLNFRRDLS